jgi:hypothetical protein
MLKVKMGQRRENKKQLPMLRVFILPFATKKTN